MRNGFCDVDSCLSVILVHVEKKEVERENNFLQVMIKNLHELHSKEKRLYNLNTTKALSD